MHFNRTSGPLGLRIAGLAAAAVAIGLMRLVRPADTFVPLPDGREGRPRCGGLPYR